MKYTLHILQIKLWEWEAVKDKWDFETTKAGPFQEAVEILSVAEERITELKSAIEILKAKQ